MTPKRQHGNFISWPWILLTFKFASFPTHSQTPRAWCYLLNHKEETVEGCLSYLSFIEAERWETHSDLVFINSLREDLILPHMLTLCGHTSLKFSPGSFLSSWRSICACMSCGTVSLGVRLPPERGAITVAKQDCDVYVARWFIWDVTGCLPPAPTATAIQPKTRLLPRRRALVLSHISSQPWITDLSSRMLEMIRTVQFRFLILGILFSQHTLVLNIFQSLCCSCFLFTLLYFFLPEPHSSRGRHMTKHGILH